jgi:hypothetical protein
MPLELALGVLFGVLLIVPSLSCGYVSCANDSSPAAAVGEVHDQEVLRGRMADDQLPQLVTRMIGIIEEHTGRD